MADFFVFLGTYISSFLKPIFSLLLDNRIAAFLGTSLLTAAVGFFVIRFLYNVFISHRDAVSSSVITSLRPSLGSNNTFNNSLYVSVNRPAITTYSSAYRAIGDGK